MEKVMTASVPAHLWEFLRPGMTGEIILVSSSGIYLRMEEQILLLCDQSWGILPIGIGIENFEQAVCLLRPRQGQQVTVSENCLMFRAGNIHLVMHTLQPETVYTCSVQPDRICHAAEELAELRKERGLSMLVLPLVLEHSAEETTKQNPYCVHGYFYLRKLMAALRCGDGSGIHSCVEKLLGLGMGLTPSGDDVLLGMLYVFRALPQKAPKGAQPFQESIGQLCDRCTNQISAAYLKAILTGAPFERMDRVFRGLCAEEKLEIENLTQIGSSSGTEMLLGMLIALQICK